MKVWKLFNKHSMFTWITIRLPSSWRNLIMLVETSARYSCKHTYQLRTLKITHRFLLKWKKRFRHRRCKGQSPGTQSRIRRRILLGIRSERIDAEQKEMALLCSTIWKFSPLGSSDIFTWMITLWRFKPLFDDFVPWHSAAHYRWRWHVEKVSS